MGFELEVDMIAAAHKLDLLTTPYVFNPDEAASMTRAGADIFVAHMGVTTGGSIGASTAKSLDECVGEIDAIASAALPIRNDVIVLCHGGPIAMPHDAMLHPDAAGPARFLRRQFDGAIAGRNRHPRPDRQLQGPDAAWRMKKQGRKTR